LRLYQKKVGFIDVVARALARRNLLAKTRGSFVAKNDPRNDIEIIVDENGNGVRGFFTVMDFKRE
jgi:hypothetical protein